MTFEEWRATVNEGYEAVYLIDLEDAGYDDDELREYYEAGDTPGSFVRWTGEKYDLDSAKDPWFAGPERAKVAQQWLANNKEDA